MVIFSNKETEFNAFECSYFMLLTLGGNLSFINVKPSFTRASTDNQSHAC